MPWTGQDKTYTSGDEAHPKHHDPYRFVPADDFFESFAGKDQPTSVTCKPEDQATEDKTRNPACHHGRIFRFNNDTLILIQFIRPLIWRIQFHSAYRKGSDFTDWNTRTLLEGRLSKLTRILDTAEDIVWDVEFDPTHVTHYILRSVVVSRGKRYPAVELWVQRSPFRVTAIRRIKTASTPGISPYGDIPVDIPGPGRAIIWQTKENPLQHDDHATILSVEKHPHAKYMGFGGQGGKKLFKDNMYLNYFNFDNMRYNNIYGKGPEEAAEPLYHSEPFWIETNRHTGYMSQTATFVDNYSHVCLDLGKTDKSSFRIATRFNSFQGIFMAGNTVAELIRLYTSIIGKPRLMPRYVLGYHQGCYGYDRQWKVEEVVRKYRECDFPLDGMHIDVDMQKGYRTFTIDRKRFPEPEKMFLELRKQGVRCSTNITPVINCTPDASYASLNDGLAENHFVLDRRSIDSSAPTCHDQRYMQYGNADLYFTNPNAVHRRPYPDDYDFEAHFNKSVPFHGGVSYGDGQGAPGHYPNLNNRHTREWWGKQYKDLFDAGLEFVWQDMTSPCIGEAYGDMKSWPFRLLLESDTRRGEQRRRRLSSPATAEKDGLKTAIELWSLYSLNLHKATFKGLTKLASRKGKRNFIIGRGSFAGAQRYAGLWTGDNASTWEFLNVSISQVLSLGLSGMTVAGADVGGFELAFGESNFANPELLIRWYCANSLLPWFRNHYSGKHEPFEDRPDQPRDCDKKIFQEPYMYEEYYQENKSDIPEHERGVYEAVLPVCRYYVQLRYSFLQMLYDAMFESTITGLPIARPMVITDPLDSSLFAQNSAYTDSQYLAGPSILVAPSLAPSALHPRRDLYLPSTSAWFPMNLRPSSDDHPLGAPLLPRVPGGTHISYDCRISASAAQLPYTCPMYIREGAIIPQILVRPNIPDRMRPDVPAQPANPITIHVYPDSRPSSERGHTYRMYLDDGVSRASAPEGTYFATLPTTAAMAVVDHHPHGAGGVAPRANDAYGDHEARSAFRRVDVTQWVAGGAAAAAAVRPVSRSRRIEVRTGWDGYGDEAVRRDVGDEYRVVVWHEEGVELGDVRMEVEGDCGAGVRRWERDEVVRADVVWVPVDAQARTMISVTYGVSGFEGMGSS